MTIPRSSKKNSSHSCTNTWMTTWAASKLSSRANWHSKNMSKCFTYGQQRLRTASLTLSMLLMRTGGSTKDMAESTCNHRNHTALHESTTTSFVLTIITTPNGYTTKSNATDWATSKPILYYWGSTLTDKVKGKWRPGCGYYI